MKEYFDGRAMGPLSVEELMDAEDKELEEAVADLMEGTDYNL